jgi:diadenosine tetraphosphate (Ap4A) HIT family hydrolase
MHGTKRGFELDRRLERDSEPLIWLGLCELRVMNDQRWPWLVLIPQRPGITEFHDLTPLDQTMLTFEMALVSKGLKQATGCLKVNVAALGNVVSQLHVHVVARNEGDPGWPGPIWGFGSAEPYRREDLHRFVNAVRSAL